ncbi:aldehyde dehydrogenase family protein [Mycolicibacterium sphagni]|uniref:aldehyde dehydrogenase family protein n=1 Tax=Mycolicibacterium sphagni TaxID=1786 RepID=UPI0039763BB3|nr:aldehyde dehydrogenase family protein [Mycolicibacterium sphagni]
MTDTIEVFNPSTEELIAEVVDADKAAVDAAVARARETFESGFWRKLPAANDTEYGLAGAIWTERLGRAHRMANELRAGQVLGETAEVIHDRSCQEAISLPHVSGGQAVGPRGQAAADPGTPDGCGHRRIQAVRYRRS